MRWCKYKVNDMDCSKEEQCVWTKCCSSITHLPLSSCCKFCWVCCLKLQPKVKIIRSCTEKWSNANFKRKKVHYFIWKIQIKQNQRVFKKVQIPSNRAQDLALYLLCCIHINFNQKFKTHFSFYFILFFFLKDFGDQVIMIKNCGCNYRAIRVIIIGRFFLSNHS